MKTNSNQPNRKSIRLKNYDYRSNGCYFVTICTYKKICYFGQINNNQVNLSELGKIAEKFWLKIPQHFDFVKIDQFIIMPNHIHGIILINKKSTVSHNSQTFYTSYVQEEYECKLSKNMSNISPKKGSLSSIIRSYKSAVTQSSKKNHYENFGWQSRFYEHIIRDEESLNKIRNYIINNPVNWKQDENYIVL